MVLVPLCSALIYSETIQEVLECYNVDGEGQEEKELRNLQVLETEGECKVEGPDLEYVIYANPLKTHKVNIGIKDNPKFTKIGYYSNEKNVEKIVDLLHEYHDLLPNKFSKMKGIVGELGEMRIPLTPNSKPVKKKMYLLNPIYKQKVKL
jgi:hypothetical protein